MLLDDARATQMITGSGVQIAAPALSTNFRLCVLGQVFSGQSGASGRLLGVLDFSAEFRGGSRESACLYLGESSSKCCTATSIALPLALALSPNFVCMCSVEEQEQKNQGARQESL